MKENKLVSFFILVFFSIELFASSPYNKYLLDNYRIPVNKKGVFVANVLTRDFSKVKSLKILQDTAKIFSLGKSGSIFLKKNVMLKASEKSFSYLIKILVDGTPVDFELIKDEFIKNKVIAHRGAWKNTHVDQNSVRSLENACRLKCAGSEFDVWLSYDKVLMISHDPEIGILSIEKSKYSDLTSVTLPNGDNAPTLEKYLSVGKMQNKTALILEIKSSNINSQRTLELTDSIVSLIHRMRAQGWVEYISFDYNALKRVLNWDPMAKTAYLGGDKSLEVVKADKIKGIDYSFYSYMSDSSLIQSAKKMGISTNVWTVNVKDELKFYFDQDVNYITTDEPEILLQIIKENDR